MIGNFHFIFYFPPTRLRFGAAQDIHLHPTCRNLMFSAPKHILFVFFFPMFRSEGWGKCSPFVIIANLGLSFPFLCVCCFFPWPTSALFLERFLSSGTNSAFQETAQIWAAPFSRRRVVATLFSWFFYPRAALTCWRIVRNQRRKLSPTGGSQFVVGPGRSDRAPGTLLCLVGIGESYCRTVLRMGRGKSRETQHADNQGKVIFWPNMLHLPSLGYDPDRVARHYGFLITRIR